MRPITNELLEECFYNGRFSTQANKWKVVTEHGRVFEFDDKHFDFSQCLSPLVAGETEDDREETAFAACCFAQEVWGCVDVRVMGFVDRGRIARYAAKWDFTVDENTFRAFSIAEAKASFGEAAIVRNSWFPLGWRITVPDVGSVVINGSKRELYVRSIEGNLYGETLRFMEKRQGHAIVYGKASFCAPWVTHGEMLFIKVFPEIPRTLLWFYLFGHITTIVWFGVAYFLHELFPRLNLWVGIAAGLIAAMIAMNIGLGDSRKRGAELLNKFPQTGSRNAKLDDARSRGML